jgi:hypothetical protein
MTFAGSNPPTPAQPVVSPRRRFPVYENHQRRGLGGLARVSGRQFAHFRLRIDLKAVGWAEVGMNFDGPELAYEDGPHAARRRCILGPGRAAVLRL